MPIWFSDGNGNPAVPPHNQMVLRAPQRRRRWTKSRIPTRSRAPTTGGPRWLRRRQLSATPYVYGGGSYSNCSDSSQPGVAAILSYLTRLPHPIKSKLPAGHYYLLNNYNPGYFGDGTNAYTDTNSSNTPFTIPPSKLRNIAERAGAAKFPGIIMATSSTPTWPISISSTTARSDRRAISTATSATPFQYSDFNHDQSGRATRI